MPRKKALAYSKKGDYTAAYDLAKHAVDKANKTRIEYFKIGKSELEKSVLLTQWVGEADDAEGYLADLAHLDGTKPSSTWRQFFNRKSFW